MKSFATILALLLASCATTPTVSDPPPNMREARLSDFNFNLPRDHRWACGNFRQNGSEPGKPADCNQLGEPGYYRGTWLNDRETSFFSFNGEKDCWEDHGDAVECVDLEMTAEQYRQIPFPKWAGCTSEYRLEFIGRRTLRPVMIRGGYPGYLIVVDRVISAKRLGYARPEHNICGKME